MADDVVEVFNLALSACGERATVSSADEASREAELCNLWYATVRDQVLHAAPWPSTKAAKRLAVLVERDVDEDWVSTDPDPGWRFAYSAPADMLRPRHLSSFERFILSNTADNRRAIMTNSEETVLIYSKRQEQVSQWDAALKMAIVYGLAAHISMPLSAKPTRAELLIANANQLINEARAAAANSDEARLETMPEWITARGYAGYAPDNRFFYASGPLLQITEGVNVR